MKVSLSAGLLLPLALAACAPMMADPATLSSDALFAQAATGSNLFEIQSSQLALQNASAASVKTFAQQMITDHTAAQNQLMGIAKTQNILLPTTLTPDKQLKLRNLAALSGAAFDSAYLTEQVLAHQLTLSVLQNELSAGANADLKGYASAQVPVVTGHLNMAQSMTQPTTTPSTP